MSKWSLESIKEGIFASAHHSSHHSQRSAIKRPTTSTTARQPTPTNADDDSNRQHAHQHSPHPINCSWTKCAADASWTRTPSNSSAAAEGGTQQRRGQRRHQFGRRATAAAAAATRDYRSEVSLCDWMEKRTMHHKLIFLSSFRSAAQTMCAKCGQPIVAAVAEVPKPGGRGRRGGPTTAAGRRGAGRPRGGRSRSENTTGRSRRATPSAKKGRRSVAARGGRGRRSSTKA